MGTLIKHTFVCFIKAIIPLNNYEDEPSVSNGILYQLPSSHLFIHWVPTKLSNRVMPYGVNYRQLQLLFVFDSYRPTAFFKKTDFQWTLSFVSSVGLVGDAVHFTLHPGFLSRTLPDFRYFLQSGKALEYMIQSCSYATCTDCSFGLTISLNIFFGSYVIPFVRIAKITLSILQAITINDCNFFSGLSFRVV